MKKPAFRDQRSAFSRIFGKFFPIRYAQASEGQADVSVSLSEGTKSGSPAYTLSTVRFSRGFSLIELIVVMAIFSIISVVILANHSRFDSQVLLSSLAYKIALTIREAQVYGLSVQQYNSQFQIGYGVHVDTANTGQYIFFVDTNSNKIYDNTTDSILKQFTIGKQHRIQKFCGVRSTGEKQCSDGSTAVTIANLDIVFLRPDPDALISSDQLTNYSGAEIWVASPAGTVRGLSVVSTGQISITATP